MWGHRWLTLGALAAVFAGVGTSSAGAATTSLVSADLPDANESPGYSFDVSSNGRYVVFDSLPPSTGVVPPGDLFIRDVALGVTRRVTTAADNDSKSIYPSMNGDGRYVAFASLASLTPGDTWGWTYYVYDGLSETFEKIADTGGGTRPAISGNGRFVAYQGSGDQVYVRDRFTGTTQTVSVASETTTPGNSQSGWPALSDDGRYVAFISLADNLVADDTNSSFDVFHHDTQTGVTRRVSQSSDGQGGDDNSFIGVDGAGSALSNDGRYVAFESQATNLVPGDTNSSKDVFVRDVYTGETSLVSGSEADPADSQSQRASISANGRRVAFDSHATNLAGAPTAAPAVYVKDLDSGVTERVAVNSDGDDANASSFQSAITGDGGSVAFASTATNLATPDPNGSKSDLFIYRAAGGVPPECPNVEHTIDRGQTLPLAGQCTDADGDQLTYGIVQGPMHGSLIASQPGTPSVADYVPHAGFVGTDSFTYKVNDGFYESNVATVTIHVVDPDGNVAPVCPELVERGTQAGQPILLPGECTDADTGDVLTYSLVDGPDNGTIGFGPSYVPNPGFTGVDSLTYRASDYQAESNVGTVRIVVADPANYEELPPGGGAVSTGSDATAADPVVTTVESPVGGVVAIFEGAESDPTPGGYTLLGQAIGVEAPNAPDPANPLRLTFRYDSSVLEPAGARMIRNGVPVPDCDDESGTATPNPCQLPVTVVDGDVVLTVLTTRASIYQAARPDVRVPSNKDECKDGGWRDLSDGSKPFKNQGDCVRFVRP